MFYWRCPTQSLLNFDSFCLFEINKDGGSSGNSPVEAVHSRKQLQSPDGKNDSVPHHKHNESNTERQHDSTPKRYAGWIIVSVASVMNFTRNRGCE